MTSFPFDLTAAPAKFDPTPLTRTGAAGSDVVEENLFQLHLRPPSSSSTSGSSHDASGSATNYSSNSTTTSPSSASGASASSARSSYEAAKSHREEESDSDASKDASPHDVEDSAAAAPADEAARRDDKEQDSRQSDDGQASQDDGSAAAAGDEKQSNPEVGQAVVVEHASEVTGEQSATERSSEGSQRDPGGGEQVKANQAKSQTNPSDAVEGVPTAVGKSNENEESEAIYASTTDEEGAKKKTEPALKVDDRAAGRTVTVAPARTAKDGEAQSGVTAGRGGETTASPDAAVAETPRQQSNGDAPRRDRRSRPQVQPSRAVTNQAATPTAAQAATTPAEKVVVELRADKTSTGDPGSSAPVASAESNHDATPAAPRPAGAEAAPVATSGGGRLSQQLVSHARQAGESGPQLTEAHQTRLINRVARAFQSAGEGGGEIRLRLSPPELGSLRLEVKIHSGVLSAHIEADTPATRTLLLHNLHVLRERLEQQNIRVEQFDVDLSDRQPGNLPNDPRDAHGQQSPRPRELSSSVEGETGGNETPRPGNAAAVGGNDQLNVIV